MSTCPHKYLFVSLSQAFSTTHPITNDYYLHVGSKSHDLSPLLTMDAYVYMYICPHLHGFTCTNGNLILPQNIYVPLPPFFLFLSSFLHTYTPSISTISPTHPCPLLPMPQHAWLSHTLYLTQARVWRFLSFPLQRRASNVPATMPHTRELHSTLA